MAKGNSNGDAFSLVMLLGPFLGLWLLFWLVPLLLGVDLSLQNAAWHSEAVHQNKVVKQTKNSPLNGIICLLRSPTIASDF